MCKGGYNYSISNSEVAEAFKLRVLLFLFCFYFEGDEKNDKCSETFWQ